MNHAPDCAFAVSYGDEACDCNGPPAGPEPEPGTLTATAREHLEIAREALRTRGAKA